MTSAQRFLATVNRINVWTKHGERAPHKPLLLLLALGRFSAGVRQLPFLECRVLLTRLLREFGPARIAYHPEYPFWRLQKNKLWVVEPEHGYTLRASNSDPTVSSLLSLNAVGGFPAAIEQLLAKDPCLIHDAANGILTRHFPRSLHTDILSAVGLSSDWVGQQCPPRNPLFRQQVLIAYGYACAVCRFSLRINDTTIGLDAAHIMWRQANGPDTLTNGLALCVLHHKLFDKGAFTLDSDQRVLVSERVSGSEHFHHSLMAYHGAHLSTPVRTDDRPDQIFIEWHRKQVFKESPRPI
jgi:putative restriction endonuclease